MNGFDEIEWESGAFIWSGCYDWPLPEDVAARIETAPTVIDGRCAVIGIRPDRASGGWLCFHPHPGAIEGTVRPECDVDGDGSHFEAVNVRFGVGPVDVFDRMPEHDGW